MRGKKTSASSLFIIIVLTAVLAYVIYNNAQKLEQEIPDLTNVQPVKSSTGSGGGVLLNQDTIVKLDNTNQMVTERVEFTATDFKVEYPSDWQLEQSEASGIRTYTFSSGEDEVILSLMDSGMQGIVEDSLSVEQESEIEIGGISARKLKGADLKDGSPVITIILMKDGTLYNFNARNEEKLNQIIDYFAFI